MISPRSEETEAKYQAFKKAKREAGVNLDAFNLEDEIVVREFNYWLIIENRFPYDNMTSTNHMLIPRRNLIDLHEANELEIAEHKDILELLTQESYYDAILENFPRSKSVTRHIHLHLVRWKYTTDEGRNKNEQTAI